MQAGFLISSLLVGWQFHRFIVGLNNTEFRRSMASLNDLSYRVLAARPASVEAWLPISSLMSLVNLIRTGVADRMHPAGLVIFMLALSTALLMRRGFCSWVCPIGTISEYAHKAGRKLLGFNLRMPIWLDIPLRLARYGLLGFFLYVLFLLFPARGLTAMIHGEYSYIVDAKMYHFMFTDMSRFALSVIIALTMLSVLFKNFWCRYLCPYGALLGLFSFISPVGIRRDKDICIDCGKCSKACPNRVAVHRKRRVMSVECTACYSCVSACPKPGALAMRPMRSKRKVSPLLYGVIIVGLFVLVPQVAKAMGYWQANIDPVRYYRLYINRDVISHP